MKIVKDVCILFLYASFTFFAVGYLHTFFVLIFHLILILFHPVSSSSSFSPLVTFSFCHGSSFSSSSSSHIFNSPFPFYAYPSPSTILPSSFFLALNLVTVPGLESEICPYHYAVYGDVFTGRPMFNSIYSIHFC